MPTIRARRRGLALLAGATASLLAGSLVTAVSPAQAATPTITIADPGSPVAGPVELQGTASAGALETTTVLYIVDVSSSTDDTVGLDCDGDGNPNQPADDLNGDGSVGDVLDCEVSGVKALNNSLVSSAGSIAVSLESFAAEATPINLDPAAASPVYFAAPGATNAAGQSLLLTAAATLRRPVVSATLFDKAVMTALNTLTGAPPGPKYILLLSDGLGDVAPETISALSSSGAILRSYSVGFPGGCDPAGALARLAAVTGQGCATVTNPSGLAAELSGSQPENVTAVRVSIGGETFPAELDISGGWRARLRLGAGTYTVRATATLTSGATVSAETTVTVGPSASGPPPGTVAGGAVKRSEVWVRTPKSSTAALPGVVKGLVGTPRSEAKPKAAKALNGATVLLQGRPSGGGAWSTVARASVADGKYRLKWTKRSTTHRLRVKLLPYRSFQASSRVVPRAHISACSATGSAEQWTIRCRTTAANGTPARLLRGDAVVARTTVARGHVEVTGTGRVSRHSIVVDVSSTTHYRLNL